jgi:hypothetical protein
MLILHEAVRKQFFPSNTTLMSCDGSYVNVSQGCSYGHQEHLPVQHWQQEDMTSSWCNRKLNKYYSTTLCRDPRLTSTSRLWRNSDIYQMAMIPGMPMVGKWIPPVLIHVSAFARNVYFISVPSLCWHLKLIQLCNSILLAWARCSYLISKYSETIKLCFGNCVK